VILSKPTASNAPASSTKLWLVDGRGLQADDLGYLQARLSMDEARHYARFVRAERQRQYLLGRMLLRLAVGRLLGLPPAAVSAVDRIGLSPSLVLPAGCKSPGFSLSHSGHWVACAVSPCAVLGLDVEIIDAGRDLAALAETAFHPAESAWLSRCSDVDRVAAFYRLWTVKEALYKLMSNLGGMQETAPLVDDLGAPATQGNGWFSQTMTHQDIAIALCGTQPLADITLVDASQLMRAA
jgi:4'-phosphopantetheinyl transferase